MAHSGGGSSRPIVVRTRTRLHVTYTLHEAPVPQGNRAVVLHHGICHTRQHFGRLIEQLNAAGVHAAMIDQQSERAWPLRNCIGVASYVEGMAAAVREIEKNLPVGSYALHSMGALIGEEMQQRYQEFRRPTVLMAPIPMNGAGPITWKLLQKDPQSYFQAVLHRDIQSLAATPQQVRELFFDGHTPAELVEEATEQLKHAPFWIYCQMVFRWMMLSRIRDDRLPKLLLFSETDGIFAPAEYDKTRARYRQLREHRIAGGHDFFIEYAHEAAEQIAAFHEQHIAYTHDAHQAVSRPLGVAAGLRQPVEPAKKRDGSR